MEKRHYDRTTLSQDFSGQLYLDGQTYSDVPVTNIGLNGCCLELPVEASRPLKRHVMLDDLLLSRPHSGPYFLKARVAWHARPWFGLGRSVHAGLQFLETPEPCARELRERVAEGMSHMAP